ncbi:methylmalonyl-CoA mutase family protein [Nakamurella deserti]|uniref:methylmalonyl-CoA mutase family protein n=1 Tax=Nakamurella deserti TaxID=2164074 RepID=UPI000DBE2038|nr:methylmalonyl-CoA mutase family protein [Nakamurella deserti]
MTPTPESTGQAVADRGPAREWASAAAAVARRARLLGDDAPDEDAWAALARRTLDGVPVPPLGTADRAPRPLPGAREGRRDTAGWDVRSVLVGGDATRVAEDAVAELETGATSLVLTVGGPGVAVADVGVALSEVYLEMAPVVLDVRDGVDELEAARALVATLRKQGVAPAIGTNFGADPVGRAVRRRAVPDTGAVTGQVGALMALAVENGTLALVVDATVAHDAGAAEVGELGYSMAVGVAYLRAAAAAGIGPGAAAALLEFRYAATADQFLTLAKFRAARVVWRRVLELCGVGPDVARQRQHGVSSRPMLTRYDPWVNLLRGTVGAFAAGAGGADAVTVLPFDTALGAPLGLGRRLARNTSALLISESHTARVNDPAGGAYAVEMLTADLAARGWAEFGRIEAAGGVLAALADGSLYAGFDAAGAQRRRRIADRRLPVTGVTEFPDAGEELLPRPAGTGDDQTPPGWAAEFEELRDRAGGGRVFLAVLGPLAEHNARAQFAVNALAVGGIAVDRSGPDLDTAELVDAFARSGRSVVCLAGTDTAYRERGAEVVSALRAAGAGRIVLAGRPPAELGDLVDDHLAVGGDLLALLRRTHDHLTREEVQR